MIEFVAFGLVSSGVLLYKSRNKGQKNVIDLIDRFFRNAGVGINERDKEGQSLGVKFPKYIGSKSHDWGDTYTYRLPIGMVYRNITDKIQMDDVLESMLNRDVEVEKGTHNHIHIHIYRERMPEIVEYDLKWLDLVKGYSVIIGVDGKGQLIFHDFDKVPHMIIGGMTRYGKSVAMKLLITQLSVRSPGLDFHLFDLKGGLAFNRFKKLPQVKSVSRSDLESLSNLKNLRNDIEKRMKYFEAKGYEDIKEAWAAGETFKRNVIIIDEASVLAPRSKSDQVRNECRDIIEFIAQVTAGLGYNLITCSQYPTGDILPRQVKQNSDARISFRLPTSTASNVILDESGAEELPFRQSGRAIYKTDEKRIIQVPYLSNEVIDDLIGPLKGSVKDDYKQRETFEQGGSDTSNPEEAGFVLPFTPSEDT